jgi:uncharacterized protein (TIGR02246 family)
MSSSVELHVDRDKENISAVRESWLRAVKDSDVDRLADLMTFDVVGVHADGRCSVGKEELKKFFLDAFDQFNMSGSRSSSEIAVHGIWAVEIDKLEIRRTSINSMMSVDAQFQIVVVFSRQLDDSWKIARIIELKD